MLLMTVEGGGDGEGHRGTLAAVNHRRWNRLLACVATVIWYDDRIRRRLCFACKRLLIDVVDYNEIVSFYLCQGHYVLLYLFVSNTMLNTTPPILTKSVERWHIWATEVSYIRFLVVIRIWIWIQDYFDGNFTTLGHGHTADGW